MGRHENRFSWHVRRRRAVMLAGPSCDTVGVFGVGSWRSQIVA
jgi:hypothetical protein